MITVHAPQLFVPRLFRGLPPPAPVMTPTYVNTYTTTTDETTTTWSGVSIGPEHPKRIVILAGHHGNSNTATAVVNGNVAFFRVNNSAHEFSVHACMVPCGTTAVVEVSCNSSLRKAFSVWYAYPDDHMPIDFGTATANTATNATITNFAVRYGGFAIYAGGQHAISTGTFTTTYTGETVTERVDAQYESASSYTMGEITDVSESRDTVTLTLAEDVSGTKRLAAASWGPAWGRYR